jgi:hypothetical protein
MKTKFFSVVLFSIVILAVEVIMIQYMTKTIPDFSSKIVSAELRNFSLLVGSENIEIIYELVAKIQHFFYQFSFNEKLFDKMLDVIVAPVTIATVRTLTLLFSLPCVLLGVILGATEGYVEHYKKIESFTLKSSLLFHFAYRSCVVFYLIISVTYLFSPLPVNPYIILYSFGIVAFVLTQKIVANFPFRKI